jgi:hypothetical protein
MNLTRTDASHWRITHVHLLPCGEYSLELEPVAGGDMELAMVSIVDRAEHDPQLTVESCTGRAARVWLETLEHERHIIDTCLEGVSTAAHRAELRRVAAEGLDRALRLVRGEAVAS